MIDTHCHLNFEAFDTTVEKTITDAKDTNITHLIVPGTDIASSRKAIELAQQYDGISAAVGIHPHHAFELREDPSAVPKELEKLNDLVDNDTVVAIGEIGLDRHIYEHTKYQKYALSEEFLQTQQRLFTHQMFLGTYTYKPLIVHNRESADWLLQLLRDHWNDWYSEHMVFHCCEANEDLLRFAKERKIFIGVDGDVTYSKKKARFVEEVPIELLVLETDSPYLTPEPTRSEKKFPNEPKNLITIAEKVAIIKHMNMSEVESVTTQNARKLFSLD